MFEAQIMELAKQNGLWRPGTDNFHSLSQQIINTQSEFQFISGRNCYDVLDQLTERAEIGLVKATNLIMFAQDPRRGTIYEKYLGPAMAALGTAICIVVGRVIKKKLDAYSN